MTSPVGSQLGDLHLYVWMSLSAPLEQQLDSPTEEQLDADWLSRLGVGRIIWQKRGICVTRIARVDVSLRKTLNPELLPVAMSTVCECNTIVSYFG